MLFVLSYRSDEDGASDKVLRCLPRDAVLALPKQSLCEVVAVVALSGLRVQTAKGSEMTRCRELRENGFEEGRLSSASGRADKVDRRKGIGLPRRSGEEGATTRHDGRASSFKDDYPVGIEHCTVAQT